MVGTVPKIHPRGKRNFTFGGSPTKSAIDPLSFLHFACPKQQQNNQTKPSSASPRAHLLASGSYGLCSSGIVPDSISSLNWRWIYIHLWARNQRTLSPGNERTHTIRFHPPFVKGQPGCKPVFPECVFIVNKRQVGTSGKSIELGVELAVY